MGSEYIKSAIRNLLRRKLFGLISIIGLGAGIAIATMIGIFLRYETSFDTMHPNHERLYRLNWVNVGTGAHFATFFNPLSPRIAAADADIEAVTRMAPGEEPVTINGESQYEVVTFVDPNFFDFFNFPAVHGDPATAVENARSAIITRAAAEKLFGSIDVIGRTLTLDRTEDFTVGAVVENNPSNSHITSNIFINMELLPTIWGWQDIWESWGSDQLYHYVRLASGADPAVVSDRAIQYMADNIDEDAREWVRIPLQSVTDIHFSPELQNEMSVRDPMTGIVKTQRQTSDLYVFAIVGILTLSIAAFNFMNLQIVQISNRLREVGVRKILGATRRQMSTQFMIETALMSLLALVISMVITEVALPYFGGLVGADLPSGLALGPDAAIGLFVVFLIVTFLGGAYPASMAARLMPTLALKGELAKNVGPAKVRTGLVLLQFSMATGLIIASGVVGSQIDYALSKPLGFDATGIVTLRASRSASQDKYAVIKSELERHPAITRVSTANIVPSQDLSNGFSFGINPDDPEEQLSTRTVTMGYNAFEMLGMEIIAGRGFSEDFPGDEGPSFSPDILNESSGLVLNETAVRQAGWAGPEDAIGKVIVSSFERNNQRYRYEFTVIGVARDAHYRSVRSPIAPMSYMLAPLSRQMIIKIDRDREAEALAAIDATWYANFPETPIRRAILAEEYAAFYASENQTFSLIIGFAGIAVVIACLGLYGLTAYLVERRVKEVGIRKVLGATVTQLVTLLSWDYTKSVIIATLIAWPIVWWFMGDWLAGFAYRADLSVSLFMLASLTILSLAALTTSLRTLSAARANPIHALRTE